MQQFTERQRRKAAQKELKKPITKFTEVDIYSVSFVPKGMTRAFRNTKFMVMVYDDSLVSTGTAIKVLVQKHDDTPFINHWAEMQNIKNEIFGKETVAIEYYPAESKLINLHNIYWMWIYPEGVLPIPL